MENFKYFGSNGEEGIIYVNDLPFRNSYGRREKGQSLKEWQQQSQIDHHQLYVVLDGPEVSGMSS